MDLNTKDKKLKQQQQRKQLFDQLYHDPKSSACFAGAQRLYEEAKKVDRSVRKTDVQHYLEGDRTYTLHRPRRVRFKRASTIPAGLFTDIQCDLADMKQYSRHNRGYKYILVAVDVLSKRLFALPVRSKQYADMISVFDDLLDNQIPATPARIFSDRGTEFLLTRKEQQPQQQKQKGNSNKEVMKKDYFREHGIEKYVSSTKTIKAALAERAIRTLKTRLYRYFSEAHTLNWIDVLQQLVDAINNSPSRAIGGMKPVEVNWDNAQQLWEKVYGKQIGLWVNTRNKKKEKLPKGTQVRMANYKEVFDKGYLPNWSDEILEIDSIKRMPSRKEPPVYRVKDAKGTTFKGNFYAEDLGKTRLDEETSYRIQKVIGRRQLKDGTRQLRVKFFGLPEPEWINETDLV